MRGSIITMLFAGLFFSCGDNDLEIETINFNDVALQFCTAPRTNAKNVLFKINDTESLILELQSGVLGQGVIGDTIVIESTVPAQSQLTYRIFSAKGTKDYFCNDIPPMEPKVLEEVQAEGGMVIIETAMGADSSHFAHTIRLSGISFVTGKGERITNMDIDDFGEVTTAIP